MDVITNPCWELTISHYDKDERQFWNIKLRVEWEDGNAISYALVLRALIEEI